MGLALLRGVILENERNSKIELVDINKIFKARRQTVYAAKDINIHVKQGEFVSLLGPSGCGKSTIIRMIADIIKPSSGQIFVDGEEITKFKRIPKDINRKIGFIFQMPNLFPWLTVRENVKLPLTVYNVKNEESENYVDELIDMVGMHNVKDAYPFEISGGAVQMIGVIRALVHKPEILLMDEPFGVLDAATRESLDLELLSIWKKMKKTIIFITHNVNEAVLLSDRVYVMGTNPGRILENITIDLERPRSLDMLETDEFVEYCELLTNHIGKLDLSKIV